MNKTLIVLTLMCSLILPISAAEKVYFTKVNEAVAFITKCLNSSDQKSLSDACVGKRPLAFEKLKTVNKKTPLTKLYSQKEFPTDKNEFTLGGCGFEFGWIHIDFIKIGGKWYLKDIWECK